MNYHLMNPNSHGRFSARTPFHDDRFASTSPTGERGEKPPKLLDYDKQAGLSRGREHQPCSVQILD